MEVWSLFSGAMGLDIGLERAGLPPSLAVDIDLDCRETAKLNRPKLKIHPHGDVTQLTAESLRKYADFRGDVFALVGGPPCQSFSTGGKRAALGDPRGNLVYTYLGLIDHIRPKYFVLENVASLVTAAVKHRPISERPGKHWSLKKYEDGTHHAGDAKPMEADELSGSAIRRILKEFSSVGYQISLGVLNSADFGAPQKRLRFIMMGALDGAPPALPTPTHGTEEMPYKTVRDGIGDLVDSPGPHSVYTEKVAAVFDQVPTGGNWRDLPRSIAEEALGKGFWSGGGKTGFYRRLPWDGPAPTVTGRMNRKATAMCHPTSTRPISVREAARLQGFPDSWEFTGSMSSQYLQVGNAVPTCLGEAVGKSILECETGKRYAPEEPWEKQLERAVEVLRASARNKKTRKKTKLQQDLFPERPL